MYANDEVNNDEKSYVFKVKGKFGEELKALFEKYAKKGEIEVEEITPKEKTRYKKEEKPSMLDSFFSAKKELKGDIEYGKSIYDKKCASCHGKHADENPYPNARVLNTLSKQELYDNLNSYKIDSNYGKSTKMIMQTQVVGMPKEDMISVSAYIYSLKHSSSK